MESENRHKNIEDLITAYLAEGIESDELRQWINASPDNKKHFQQMQEIWFASASPNHTKRFNKENGYERFLTRKDHVKAKHRNRRFSLRPLLYGAAAVVLLLIVSYTSYWQGSEQLKSQFADIVIEAPLGSKTKMYLPDGTLVWLNADSKISYSQGFGVNERTIALTGEGYFEVTKNEKLPFQVKTAELHVRVLGTKFNFRNYPEDEEATVSLLEGKVRVNNLIKSNEEINLIPDQRVFLNKKTGSIRVSAVNAQYSAEWTNGYLFFDEELLPDISKKLERSYNVKITLKDKSLENFRFYGNFIRRENTIEDILETLASTNKLKYRIEGTKIELSSK